MHPAENLKEKKKFIFTAQSANNFHPFMAYDYFLANLVEHDLIRNANNNLLAGLEKFIK